ncbi:MAG: UDP-3-O-(3-hydroxymyristoyl)glucosamine N-acyltransferase [Thermodesulfobacteriota bacterium]
MAIPLSRLAAFVSAEILGNPEKQIQYPAPFDHADENAITFVDKPALLKKIADCRAGAVLVPRSVTQRGNANLLCVENPRLAFAKIMQLFYPRRPAFSGISAAARIGRAFCCGKDVNIGPGAYIGDRVTVGDGVTIHPNAYIGDDVTLGEGSEIYPNVSILEKVVIGCRVIVHANTVVGSDGFGYTPDGQYHFKIAQVGIVQIDDDVEIGAGNTIDRATFGRTWIQEGVKTDNHVHIAHNVTVGAHSIIVAQVGIAGSAQIGRHVTIAGQAGVGGHIAIGDGATVGPQAGVTRSVDAGAVVSGTPELPHRQWLRVQQVTARLPELKKKIAALEKRLQQLESPQKNDD